MPVTFHVPTYLATFAGRQSAIVLEGSPATMGEALEELWKVHPGLRDRIVDERGEVRQHINLFVDTECVRFTGGLATPVPDGAEVFVVPAVSGG